MTGLQLLHTMSQRHYDFVDKHYQVEHQYVRFVCDLTKVLKDLPGSYEQECKYCIVFNKYLLVNFIGGYIDLSG